MLLLFCLWYYGLVGLLFFFNDVNAFGAINPEKMDGEAQVMTKRMFEWQMDNFVKSCWIFDGLDEWVVV